MQTDSRILITGSTGMVGGALTRLMKSKGFTNLLTPTRKELNLIDRKNVFDYFEKHRPEYVFMVAAKVGGIAANSEDLVGFMEENLHIELNLFSAAYQYKTKKNLFLGSSCIYPKEAPQPIKEEYLLTGPLEKTNEGYALAKISGLKLAKYYHQQKEMLTVCPMPCNIYGTGDCYDLHRSHVLSALVRRFEDARAANSPFVEVWGTGAAKREFIHVEDVAEGLLFFMSNVETSDHINLGTGLEISISDLARKIADYVGYKGEICWDHSKPDGTMRKCMDVSKLHELGFKPKVSLDQGIQQTIEEYRNLRKNGL